MKKRAEWQPVGILLEEMDGSLYVSQGGKKYKARKWKLTGELFDIIDLAIRNGLGSVWRERGKRSPQGHPRQSYFEGGDNFEEGSHHIGFSRTSEERWVFVIGGEAGPPRINKVTFEKHYAAFLEAANIQYEKITGGGKDLSINPKDLEKALDYLTENDAINEIEGKLNSQS